MIYIHICIPKKKCGQILLHPHIGLLCVILCSVILSNAKDLLKANHRLRRSILTARRFFTSFRMTLLILAISIG